MQLDEETRKQLRRLNADLKKFDGAYRSIVMPFYDAIAAQFASCEASIAHALGEAKDRTETAYACNISLVAPHQKSPESCIEKLWRIKTHKLKPWVEPDAGLPLIKDIVRGRLICDDVRAIRDLATEVTKAIAATGLCVEADVKPKDQFTSPPDSRYRGYHLVCDLKWASFEVQIQTKVNNLWSEAEHSWRYEHTRLLPPGHRLLEEEDELVSTLADLSNAVDTMMAYLRRKYSE